MNWSLHEKGSMRFHSVKSEKDGLGRFVKKKSFFGACAAGENTGREQAENLISLLSGRPCHVNLIRLNEVKERGLRGIGEKEAYRFLGMLEKGGLSATLRRTIGADVGGACGQLRASYLKEE